MGEFADDPEFEYRAREVIRHQRFPRRPKKVSTVLSRIMARRGFAQTKSRERFQEAWEHVAGPTVSGQTKVGNLRNGTLTIYVDNASALHHLTMIKEELLEAIQNQLPEANLKNLRFRAGL